MIFIDFQIDEIELAENLEDDITAENHISFVVTMFIMPVRMKIDEKDIFGILDDPWSPMPIMNVASNGLLTVKKLKSTKKEQYGLMQEPGNFEFTLLNDNDVKLVYEGFKHFEKIVKYDELLEAFEKFAKKVRDFFWERVPQLNDHLYWGPWLRGERD